MTNKTRPRKYSGFGVETRQGVYLQQYDRHTEALTRQAYEAHNPQVEGHTRTYKLLSVKKETTPLE